MEKRSLIDTWQKVSKQDFLNFGLFPETSIDTIVKNVLIPDLAFDGFVTTQTGVAQVTVSNGHLYALGKVYFNDTQGGQVIDLLARTPAATRKIVTIAVYGTEEDAQLQPRTFLTDAETRATVAREAATEHWRWANLTAVSGLEAPDPQPPALEANVLAVAYVTLSPTGVVSILPATENIVPNLRNEDNRLRDFDIWKLLIGTLIETLRSDLLALALRILGTAKWSFVRDLAFDVARIKDLMRLPQTYIAWGADHFLTDQFSSILDAAYLARIEEGCRFPPAAITDSQLGLLNIFDELVINTNNVLLPAWAHNVRLTNIGSDIELPISQYQYQTTNMVQKMMSRQVTRYGTSFSVCSNHAYWDTVGNKIYYTDTWNGTSWTNSPTPIVFDYMKWTFTRGSEVFQEVGDFSFNAGNPGDLVHSNVRLQQVWQDTVEEPYWEQVVNNYSISGAMVSETFVNSQDGWLTKIDLYLSRIAASGNIDVLICETDAAGSPLVNSIIGRSTLIVDNMLVATAANMVPTPFVFQPTFLKKGRYAFVVVTGGNHYLWGLKNTNYVSGTLFYSTDGQWFQGDLTTDIAFRMHFALFTNNVTRVQLQALTLANGITNININADAIVPDGCTLGYEIQVNSVWHALDNVDGGPDATLNGLPPLLPFRAVFNGTQDVQPALGVAANSRSETWRPRSDFTHISTPRATPSTITRVSVDVRLENWLGAPHHTFTPFLLHGTTYGVQSAPDISTNEPAPDDPSNAIIYHLVWTTSIAPGITTYKFRLQGTTDNVVTCYHIAERLDVADVA